MHIKRDISISKLKTILNVLFRIPGFSGRSKLVLTICLLSATIQIYLSKCQSRISIRIAL